MQTQLWFGHFRSRISRITCWVRYLKSCLRKKSEKFAGKLLQGQGVPSWVQAGRIILKQRDGIYLESIAIRIACVRVHQASVNTFLTISTVANIKVSGNVSQCWLNGLPTTNQPAHGEAKLMNFRDEWFHIPQLTNLFSPS